MKQLKKVVTALPWLILSSLTLFLLGFFLFFTKVQLGGDIVEYYGITESVLNHQSFELTPHDQQELEKVLHPAYFKDPGYYIHGRDNQRYPVHFVAYSLLTIPFRLLLRLFQQSELKSLWLTNIFVFVVTATVVMKLFVKEPGKRVLFLLTFFLSPLMFFFVWPGPDLLYVCLLTIAVFAFFDKKYSWATILTAVASWHSQPLIVLAGCFGLAHVLSLSKIHKFKGQKAVSIHPTFILPGLIAVTLAALPYAYNLFAFNALTPWTLLQDGWTKLRGFGIHNASSQKLFEQFFDLNFGLMWYMPLTFLIGIVGMIKEILRKNWLTLGAVAAVLLTSVFYQTNPGWHYGTAGFGPSHHIIFAFPLFMYFVVELLTWQRFQRAVILSIIASQIWVLSLNGYLNPNLQNSLRHSPFARFVLNYAPAYYEPTPEIFIDRTNRTDITFPTTAIYKFNGSCKKAYVLKTEAQKLIDECKFIPDSYQAALEDEFLRIANYPRKVTTVEATFWPNPEACGKEFSPTAEKPFVCMKTIQEVMKETGIKDEARITTVSEFPYPGIWKMTFGDPLEITVPAGYIVNHYSVNGVYVTY